MSSTISMSICVNFVSKCPKLMTKRQREYAVDRGNHVSKCSRVDMKCTKVGLGPAGINMADMGNNMGNKASADFNLIPQF